MKKKRVPRKKKTKLYSNLRKGELKKCDKCRFGYNKKCDLPFENKIEVSEQEKGYCIYFCGKRKEQK